MIKAGFHGEAPDLRTSKLSRGDVAFKMDFRSVYASVLSQWLKTDDQKVLQNKFPAAALIPGGESRLISRTVWWG